MVATALDSLTREVLTEIEQVDFKVTLDESGSILLHTSLSYDLHVRPSTYLYTRLRESGVVSQLTLRRVTDGVAEESWVAFEPLSLLALALRRGEDIQIRVGPPNSKEALLAVMDAFRGCPLYRDYSTEPLAGTEPQADAPPARPEPFDDLWQFKREFECEDNRSCLVKLNIENFLIGHLSEIESYILSQSTGPAPDGEALDEHFRRLLGGDFEHFGIMSLDVPYDNLMQIRDMCYHLHFKQLERRQKIPYTLMNIEWSREYGPSWRLKQARRLRYFYEREAAYYRELFLVLVRREQPRLSRFVDQWVRRLDYSLHLRAELHNEANKLEAEMRNFSPNFDNPDEFCRHIRLMGEMVTKNISRLSPYLRFIRDRRIYLTDWAPQAPRNTEGATVV